MSISNVNKLAQKLRHAKVTQLSPTTTTVEKKERKSVSLVQITRVIHGRPLRLKVLALSMVGLFLLSTNIVAGGSFLEGASNEEGEDVASLIDPDALLDVPVTAATTDGFLFMGNKALAQGENQRGSMNEIIQYTVQPGDTLSGIATRFDLKTDTLEFANNIADDSKIRVGQTLKIPPVDGLVVNVDKGTNLDDIAKKYKIDKQIIIAQNSLNGEQLTPGSRLIIPGAKPIVVAPPVAIAKADTTKKGSASKTAPRYASLTPPSSSSTKTIKKVASEGSGASSASGCQGFAWPIAGGSRITQRFSSKHNALDIQSYSLAATILAADDGTVELVNYGYSGGYGNTLVVNHGNGYKTRYAHLSEIYVEPGTKVTKGSALGKEGRTGRVYGKTGIHLHFMVMKDGKALNGLSCY